MLQENRNIILKECLFLGNMKFSNI